MGALNIVTLLFGSSPALSSSLSSPSLLRPSAISQCCSSFQGTQGIVTVALLRSPFLACQSEARQKSSSLGGFSARNLQKTFLPESGNAKQKRKRSFQVKGAAGPSDGVRWWEKEAPPNMHDINSTQDFISALENAGEKLIVVEFFATWCGSCRALYPKLCKLAEEYRDVEFLKVNFDENKKMCKSLNVKVLPYFHFYRGADGRLDAFSCSLAKLQKLKDALIIHSTDRCSIGPPIGVGDLFVTSDQPATAAGSTR